MRVRPPAKTTQIRKRPKCRLAVLTLALAERLEDRRLLSETGFTLLPNQSLLTLKASDTYDGYPLSFTSQGASSLNGSETSLTTHFTGTLLTTLGSGTLQFNTGSSVTAEVNGTWKPGLTPSVSGSSAAADFGGVATLPFGLGTEYVAARGLVFDFDSPVINQSGGAYAVDNNMHIVPTAGDVYYGSISNASGEDSIVGDDETDMSGSSATLATSGGIQTLTVPIKVTYTDTTAIGTVTSVYTGTLVGIAPLPSAAYYVKRDADGTHLDVYNNSTGTGTIAEQLVYSQISSMMLTTSTGTGSITIDNSAGDAVPAGGFTSTGNGNTALTIVGTTIVGTGAGDTVNQSSGQILFNSVAINYTGMTGTTLNPKGGSDILTVSAGELMLSAPPAGGGILARSFSNITIGSGAELAVLSPVSHSDRALLEVAQLTIAGTTGNWMGLLDLGGNDLDLPNANLLTTTNQVAAGYNNDTVNFQPEGITSSTAAADTTHLTTLGTIQNNQGGTAIYGSGTGKSSFDGTIPGASDILIKYTDYGDTNLSGKVDGSDYSRTDTGFIAKTATGWFNGDFNCDNKVNGSDYTLIDNAFNRQATTPLAMVATPSATVPATPSTKPTATPWAFMNGDNNIPDLLFARNVLPTEASIIFGSAPIYSQSP